MNPDDFEKHLADQPLRRVPPEWRTELLATARSGIRQPETATETAPLAAVLATKLREWLWPHPLAWGGLAAAWVIILGLFVLAGPVPRIGRPERSSFSSFSSFAASRQLQQALAAELLDGPAATAPPAPPAPRSPADHSTSPDSTSNPLSRYEHSHRT